MGGRRRHTPDNYVKHENDEADYTATNTIVPRRGVALCGYWGGDGSAGQHELEKGLEEDVEHDC